MQKAFKNIIEKVKEKYEDVNPYVSRAVVGIVKQVAEEYKSTEHIDCSTDRSTNDDLISRSELLECFKKNGIEITFDLSVEKVLGEDFDIDDFSMLVQDAIKAYRKMVIDTIKNQQIVSNEEVCEWKSEKEMFIQNPHTGRKFSNEPSMKNVYCITCGKKIKVVE